MPRFLHHPERPPIVEKKELTKELKEYPELKPKLAFSFPLNENRREALEMIYHKEKVEEEKVLKLLESPDFIEKRVGLYLLKNVPSLSDKGYERVIPLLQEISKDERWFIREGVAQSLPKLGEKGLPILEKMNKDEDWDVRIAVAQAKVKVIVDTQGENALPLLEKMRKEDDLVFRVVVQFLPDLLGEKAPPILEELGEMRILEELEEMRKDKNRDVQKAVEITPRQIKGGYKWFLALQKPLFATPFTAELAKRVLKVQKIAKKLKEEFKDKFVGITIVGSTAKGYLKPRSDLDKGIITQSRECSSKFKELAEASYLNLGEEHYAGINEKYQIEENEEVLFQGLFFGDHKKLLEIQRNLLKSINKRKWDEIRGIIMENETDLSRAEARFGLKKDEIEKITQASLLLRVPPPYREALEIVEKRAKKAGN